MAKMSEITNKIKNFSGEISEAVSDMSGSVKSVVSEYVGKRSNTVTEAEKPFEINTIGELSKWINSVQTEASPSMALVLQAQLSTLNTMESSVLMGMAIDNILTCLYKSLEIAESEPERMSVRDSFTSLLQCVIFVSEARLQYDIKKNKEAAIQMLQSAGNLISDSVKGAANILMLVTGPGAAMQGAKVAKSTANAIKTAQMLPVINNVMSPKLLEVGAMSHLLSAKKKQEMLEERIQDHNKMLNNLFNTLDRYYEMVGPSIQIHGMLSRYMDQLIEEFTENQNNEIEICTNKFSTQIRQIIEEMNISMHHELKNNRAKRRGQRISEFIVTLKDTSKNQEILGYDEVTYIYNFMKERYNSLLTQIACIKTEINEKQTQLDSLGIFQQSMKIMITSQINTLEKRVSKLNISLTDIDEKARILENIVLPVRKRIEEYSEKLLRITEKYAIC